jgi:hypothetical protein
MTTPIDLDPILDDFFAAGPERAPDRIVMDVLDDLDHVRQARSWMPVPGWPRSGRARLLLVAAILVIVAAVGAIVGSAVLVRLPVELPPQAPPSLVPSLAVVPTPTEPPTPTPSPSPTPTPTPAPSGPRPVGVASLTAGQWSVDGFDTPFVFSVDRDWGLCHLGCDPWGSFSIFHGGTGGGRTTQIWFTRFDEVYADPCTYDAGGARRPAPNSPKGFFTWLETVAQVDVGPVKATTVAGLRAMRADVTVLSTAACGGVGTIALGVSENGVPLTAATGDQDRVYAIDVHGKVFTVWVVMETEALSGELPEFERLVASLQFP